MKGWGKIKAASAYAGVSPRTMRKWLKQGLRHSRLPSGTIIISFDAIDEFLSSFEVQNDEVDQIIEEITKEVLG
jgi:predicted site-specific integrase-resolvase